jgi:hypothetical protein
MKLLFYEMFLCCTFNKAHVVGFVVVVVVVVVVAAAVFVTLISFLVLLS